MATFMMLVELKNASSECYNKLNNALSDIHLQSNKKYQNRKVICTTKILLSLYGQY